MKSILQSRPGRHLWHLFILRAALLAVPGSELFAAEKAVPPAAPEFKPFEHVQAKAAALAAKEYAKNTPELPPFLLNLDYDQYRDLRFRPDQSLWRDDNLPFQVQFFSRGSIFRERVLIHVIEQGKDVPVQFSPSMFDFGRLPVPMEVPNDLGFAGFRLHYLLNVHQYYDEVIAFLGASYFRAVGRGELYGLSARGLAVDTGLPRGEEFPVFREFWLEKPAVGAQQITVYALLDSTSVTGAYRFVINPGASTDIRVTMQLYFRKDIEKLGVAPLTSMYYHGKTTQRFVDDFRPEVHDSDGLLIEAGNGEQIWRPLNNPQRLAFSSFSVQKPRGFGLLQREREFAQYQDLESKYQLRPSAWITPIGDWGAGHVELVEIPSNGEVDDNIVAFWVPAEPVTAGSTRSFEYKLSFGAQPSVDFLGGRVVYTGIGPGRHADEGRRLFVVDFAGGELPLLPETTQVMADVSSSSGTLGVPVVERNPFAGGYRVFFEFTPGDEPLADLRCSLRSGDKSISETWIYQTWKEKY
jgi:glucans biosynthesis protein